MPANDRRAAREEPPTDLHTPPPSPPKAQKTATAAPDCRIAGADLIVTTAADNGLTEHGARLRRAKRAADEQRRR